MKRFLLGFVVMVLSVISGTYVFAGGIAISGQGVRAMGMGGAFIGVADDPTAVYYNPAGLTQTKGTEIGAGISYSFPQILYTMPNGAEQKSDKEALGPYLFFSTNKVSPVVLGFGMYSPFARVSDWSADSTNNFGPLKSKIVRIDFTPAVAYQVNPQLSVGIGFTLARGEEEWQNPAGPGTTYKDESNGYGYGGTIGILYQVSDKLNIGTVYRSKMNVEFEGTAQLITPGPTLTDDFNLNWHFPSTLGLGLSYKPKPDLLLAFDLNWTEWSYWKELSYDYKNWADMTNKVDAHNTVDLQLGAEFKPSENIILRGGYGYSPAAVPAERISPQTPDADTHSLSLGGGYALGPLHLDIGYAYNFSTKRDVTNSLVNYNGKYEIKAHTVLFAASYRF